MEIKTFYERRLPHITPIGSPLFITPRLAGSIPPKLIVQWKKEKEIQIQKIRNHFKPEKDFTGAANSQLGAERKKQLTIIQKLYFKKVDDYLDKAEYGPTYLANPLAAEKLVEKLHSFDGNLYNLVAFTVMSNHFHFLIDTSLHLDSIPSDIPITTENYIPLKTIMQLVKGGSSYEINKVIGRKGRLWQPESYDHFSRTVQEFFNIIRYIANNPVKAGLVEKWSDYPFTYVNPAYSDALIA